MSSELKNFINSNKQEFNDALPSANLWSKIESELNKEVKPSKQFTWKSWMNIAALLFVVVSIGIFMEMKGGFVSNDVVAEKNVFKNQQVHFTGLIEEKKDSLLVFSSLNPELYQQFVVDLKQLDSDYLALQEQLKTSPNQEVLVQAMIKNLEIRANMLSQQLQVFYQVNDIKKEKTL